jgi:hypothetical protein
LAKDSNNSLEGEWKTYRDTGDAQNLLDEAIEVEAHVVVEKRRADEEEMGRAGRVRKRVEEVPDQ